MDLIVRMVKAFRDLPIHTIFVTWEKLLKDEDVGSKIVPAVVGQALPETIIGYIDVCGRLYKVEKDGEVKRKILFNSVPHVAAGDRSGKLPNGMEDPTMTKIFDYLEKERGPDGPG